MIKRLALGTVAVLVAAVAVLVGLTLTRPDRYLVQREVEIAAAPAAVFANLADLRRWAKWSPWEAREPGMRRSYAGPPAGVGASYAWEGNEVGSGKLTVSESAPPSQLRLRLQFVKPFAEENELAFELTPLSAATRVRWSMSGPARFGARLLGLFGNVDPLIGRDLELGLAQLKKLSEEPSR